ncbi:MAG: glutamate--tRNA ligase [Longimicrobiales bacterium]
MSRVRTRFAPSPTGELHAGNARIAVLNWLIARHHGGAFVLRIEDTDAERNVAGAETAILADLRWLGLDWDEGPDTGGPHAPYRQSERLDLYARRARELLDAEAAYRCFCSPETLQDAREEALKAGHNLRYPGTCRRLDPDEAGRRAEAGEPHTLRLRTPVEGEVAVQDIIRGRVAFDPAEIGDFVILRSDGLPTYNFAVVVDDAAMEISHVIRGVGHLSNTPHQILLYDALGEAAPAFAHAPTVLGPEGGKLSKRSGARPLRALREEGLHPDAVVNYLSLLGWSRARTSSPVGLDHPRRER